MNEFLTAQKLAAVERLIATGQFVQAELSCLRLLEQDDQCVPALVYIAQISAQRADHVRAAEYWSRAFLLSRRDERLLLNSSLAHLNAGDPSTVRLHILELYKTVKNLSPELWLILGHAQNMLGFRKGSLQAWFQAIEGAQRHGRWISEQSTEPELLPLVLIAMEEFRRGKREWLHEWFEALQKEYGLEDLQRVRRALSYYLGDSQDGPRDSRQRPKFLYIPGLPDTPYHDPNLNSWAKSLTDSFADIRGEAMGLLNAEGLFESFLTFGPGVDRAAYVGGDGASPSWDAFFFYRHGTRFDTHHALCPKTSALLDSIDLCRIKSQAPEVCFSMLSPGSHIKPHYGVTNSRLVLHLPLLVPQDCALHVIGANEHVWREGQLMMFDDTFEHEAWNRSASPRMILLMDCWNPYLTEVERCAITQLVEAVSDLESLPVPE